MSDQRDSTFFNPETLKAMLPVPKAEQKKEVVDVTSPEHFEQLLANAKGPVVVDFVTPDCGACADAKPHVDKLAASCDVTVLRVDDTAALEPLAEKFKVEGFPTTFFAAKGTDMTPEAAEEVDPEDTKFKRRLKCARVPKGGAK